MAKVELSAEDRTKLAAARAEADQVIREQVVIPVFFAKLAEEGIPEPQTVAEQNTLLDLAYKLDGCTLEEITGKTASTQNRFEKFASALDKTLDSLDPSRKRAAARDAQVVAAARFVRSNDTIKNAGLVLAALDQLEASDAA